MSTTSSEPRMKGSGNSQWSVNGSIASPGPWKPLIAPLTLWPLEHSDERCFKSTQRSYIKHPIISTSTPPSLPSFLLWLRVWRHWFWDQLFFTFLVSSTLSAQDTFPKPKKWPRWNQAALASLPPPPQTSVCRSMMSCPTRGMVVPAFSHSTECSSRGEAARGSRSLRTHAGGDCGIPRTPSHGLSIGACCLSCWEREREEPI